MNHPLPDGAERPIPETSVSTIRLRELLAGSHDDEDRAILRLALAFLGAFPSTVPTEDLVERAVPAAYALGGLIERMNAGKLSVVGDRDDGSPAFGLFLTTEGGLIDAICAVVEAWDGEDGLPRLDRIELVEALFGRLTPVDERYDLPEDVVENGAAVYRIVERPVAVEVFRYLGEDGEGTGMIADGEETIPVAGRSTEEVAALVLEAAARIVPPAQGDETRGVA